MNIKRILVIKLSSLGDLTRPLPAVHNLKVALGAEIDWVTQDEYVDLVSCFTDIRRVIGFPRRRVFRDAGRFVSDLRRDEYDLVIDFQGLMKSALVACLARAPRRIGPSYRREGSGLLYSEIAGVRNKERHSVEEALDVVDHLGLNRVDVRFPLAFPEWMSDLPHPRVALVPCSRWASKNWPLECFADMASRVAESTDATFILLGGASDAAACAELEAKIHGCVSHVENLAGKIGLVEMGSVIQGADVVMSNDSGPAHLAAALGVPTVVVYGPTDARRTGPYGAVHTVVEGQDDCRPCFSRMCSGEHQCMRGITPERVAEAVVQAMKM